MVASDLGPMVNNTARNNGRIIHFRGPPYVLLEAEQRASVLLQLLALAGLHRVQGGVLLPGPGVRDGQLEPDLGTWTLDTWSLDTWTLDTGHVDTLDTGYWTHWGHVAPTLVGRVCGSSRHADTCTLRSTRRRCSSTATLPTSRLFRNLDTGRRLDTVATVQMKSFLLNFM